MAAVGRLLPKGVTPASGGGPSQGPSTRVGWPEDRSIRARPRTWPWTPPGMVRLYGQMRPILMSTDASRGPRLLPR